jgi:hypothetical protein
MVRQEDMSMQLAQLIEERDVGFSFVHGAKLDRSLQQSWQLQSRDYSCKLTYQGRIMSIDYWQGPGIKTSPNALGVLDCLLSDAGGFDSARDFNDWASDLGYDASEPESVKAAKKIYLATKKQTTRLKELLGNDYEEFLNAER